MSCDPLRLGRRVHWTDPDDDLASGPGTITDIRLDDPHDYIGDDTIIRIRMDSGSEVEAYPHELTPLPDEDPHP